MGSVSRFGLGSRLGLLIGLGFALKVKVRVKVRVIDGAKPDSSQYFVE